MESTQNTDVDIHTAVRTSNLMYTISYRRIFGPKRDEVTGGWMKLRNEELHGLYSSPDNNSTARSRRISWAGHVVRMGGGEISE
jgi:hypothetical protein